MNFSILFIKQGPSSHWGGNRHQKYFPAPIHHHNHQDSRKNDAGWPSDIDSAIALSCKSSCNRYKRTLHYWCWQKDNTNHKEVWLHTYTSSAASLWEGAKYQNLKEVVHYLRWLVMPTQCWLHQVLEIKSVPLHSTQYYSAVTLWLSFLRRPTRFRSRKKWSNIITCSFFRSFSLPFRTFLFYFRLWIRILFNFVII